MSIGKRIAEIRELRNINQNDLAKKLGVAQQTISKYENDSIKPSCELLAQIAELLEISSDFLLEIEIDQENVLVDTSELELIQIYRKMNNDNRKRSVSIIKTLFEEENEERNE